MSITAKEMKETTLPDLDAIAKTILSYRPPEKEKATKQREKRKREQVKKK